MYLFVWLLLNEESKKPALRVRISRKMMKHFPDETQKTKHRIHAFEKVPHLILYRFKNNQNQCFTSMSSRIE